MIHRMPVPAGRRIAPYHRVTARLHVRVPVEMTARLGQLAERENVSLAVLVEQLLNEALATHEPAQEELPLNEAS